MPIVIFLNDPKLFKNYTTGNADDKAVWDYYRFTIGITII